MARLISSYFGLDPKWVRMSNLLRHTAQTHCPNWSIEISNPTPTRFHSALGGGGRAAFIANTQKMEHWWKEVMASQDGDQILLIDADTVILHPLDSIWDLPFDIAYTTKPPISPRPFNSGVVFLRVSPQSKAFIDQWYQENVDLLCNGKEHRVWRTKYGGINQAALGLALSKSIDKDINLVPIPCVEWNCEDFSWRYFDPQTTKILHIKSRLRRSIFDHYKANYPYIDKLAKLWKQLEAQYSGAALLHTGLPQTGPLKEV